MKKPYRALQGLIVSQGEYCNAIAKAIGISPQAMSNKMQLKSPFTAAEIAAVGNILSIAPEDYYKYFIEPAKRGCKK